MHVNVSNISQDYWKLSWKSIVTFILKNYLKFIFVLFIEWLRISKV